jgi:hypothetical protein
MEASGLIDELLETHGNGNNSEGSYGAHANGSRRNAYARTANGGER